VDSLAVSSGDRYQGRRRLIFAAEPIDEDELAAPKDAEGVLGDGGHYNIQVRVVEWFLGERGY